MNQEIMTFAETAEYLKIGEKTLQRMINRKEIPCTKVGNQWRFIRSILSDWLISGMHKHSTNSVEKVILDHEVIQLSRIIKFYNSDINTTSRKNILTELAQPLITQNMITDINSYVSLLEAREAIVSTAIGKGCAIPHVRNPELNQITAPVISIGVCKEGCDFNSLDGKPTHIFFLIHTDNEATHLRILTRLTEMIRSKKTVSRMLEAENINQLIQSIIRYESIVNIS